MTWCSKLIKLVASICSLTLPIQATNHIWIGKANNQLDHSKNYLFASIPQSNDSIIFGSTDLQKNPLLANTSFAIAELGFIKDHSFEILVQGKSATHLTLSTIGLTNTGKAAHDLTVHGKGNTIRFEEEATADKTQSRLITLNALEGGRVIFTNQSTASTAKINIGAGSVNFFGEATADQASINLAGSASSAVFLNEGKAGSAQFHAVDGANIAFAHEASSQNATFNLHQSMIRFGGSAQADQAVIHATGSRVLFEGDTSANEATILATGGLISFSKKSSGDNATVYLNQGAHLLNKGSNILGALHVDETSLVTITDDFYIGGNEQDSIIAGHIQGEGTLNKIGMGTLFFSGKSSYTGDTVIYDGTLQTNAQSLTGVVINDANLVFDQTIDGLFNGQLSGSGTTVKQGQAVLQFANPSPLFEGLTEINEGTLYLANGLGGEVLVNAAAHLIGIGEILGDVTINSEGRITPGNRMGSFQISGNYSQDSDSIYRTTVNSEGLSSYLSVNGSADLDGELEIFPSDSMLSLATESVILTADEGINGKFNKVNFLGSDYFDPILRYDSTQAFLKFQTKFERFASSATQKAVARQFDQLTKKPLTTQESFIVHQLILTPVENIKRTLDELSGQIYVPLLQFNELTNHRFLRRLQGLIPFACQTCDLEKTTCFPAWIQVEGHQGFLASSHSIKGFKSHGFDINGGIHVPLIENLILGAAGNYSYDDLSYHLPAKAHLNSYQAAIYSRYCLPCFYIASDLLFSYLSSTFRRKIHVGTIDEVTKSHPHAMNGIFYVEIGKNFSLPLFATCSFDLQPFVGIETGYYTRHHFKERHAKLFNLSVKETDAWTINSKLGLQFMTELYGNVILNGEIAWWHRFKNITDSFHARFVSFGRSFHVKGLKQNREIVEGQVKVSKYVTSDLNIFGEFAGESDGRLSSYESSIGLEYIF
jgi:autotransporter-associated beta strand protein